LVSNNFALLKIIESWAQWLMPVILAIGEVETENMEV
jgi:hypothetical protein